MNRKEKTNSKKSLVLTSSVLAMATMLAVSEIDRQDMIQEISKSKQEVLDIRNSYENLSLKLETVTHDGIALEKLKNKQLTEKQEQIDKYKSEISEHDDELKKKNSQIESLQKELSALKKNDVVSASPKSNDVTVEKKSATKKDSGHNGWSKMTVEATGYSLYSDELGGNGDGVTATGTVPTAGRTIAVDPSVIPYGTEVYIPAMGGTFIAEDTGGMIKGNKIDIYMSHGDVARQWGRQSIDVYVNL